MSSSFGRSWIQVATRVTRHILGLSSLLALLSAVPAFADDSADIGKLIKTGQFPEALIKVDNALTQRPRDAQLRFFKGLILTEQSKNAEAITVFTKLTEDFPDLPEPYNNLAVLFASSGQYDKARAALEMAIRTNPTYATAHENLGDVYAKLASKAYDKALQLDSANSGAKSKLTMVRTLIANPGSTVPVKTVVATTASSTATQKPVVAPVVIKPVPMATVAVTPPVVVVKVEPPPKIEVKSTAKLEPKPEIKPEPKVDSDHDEVLKVVNIWAKAWSAKDVKTYLSVYSGDFQTPKNESRKAWAEERRSRIEGKGRISVQVELPQVTLDGNSATIKFRQIYSSDRLTANSKKTLVLKKQGTKWQINQERTGS